MDILLPQVMRASRKAYEELNSYCDSGCIETIFDPDTEKQWTNRQFFRTFFIRPHLFRFDWTCITNRKNKYSSVWCDGKITRVFQDGKTSRRVFGALASIRNLEDSLREGLISAGTTSSGEVIARLLLPFLYKYNDSSLLNRRWESISTSDFHGESCYLLTRSSHLSFSDEMLKRIENEGHLQYLPGPLDEEHLLISKDTKLIRSFKQVSVGKSVKTISYESVLLNENIDKSQFVEMEVKKQIRLSQ